MTNEPSEKFKQTAQDVFDIVDDEKMKKEVRYYTFKLLMKDLTTQEKLTYWFCFFISALSFMLCWNYVAAGVFDLPKLSYWHALCVEYFEQYHLYGETKTIISLANYRRHRKD